jgi:hypothetical protein
MISLFIGSKKFGNLVSSSTLIDLQAENSMHLFGVVESESIKSLEEIGFYLEARYRSCYETILSLHILFCTACRTAAVPTGPCSLSHILCIFVAGMLTSYVRFILHNSDICGALI